MCLIGGVAADAVPVFFRPIYCCQLQPWPNILSLGVTTISMVSMYDCIAGSVTRCWSKKGAQMFPKVAKIIFTAVFTSIDLFLHSPKVTNHFGYFCKQN